MSDLDDFINQNNPKLFRSEKRAALWHEYFGFATQRETNAYFKEIGLCVDTAFATSPYKATKDFSSGTTPRISSIKNGEYMQFNPGHLVEVLQKLLAPDRESVDPETDLKKLCTRIIEVAKQKESSGEAPPSLSEKDRLELVRKMANKLRLPDERGKP